MTGWMVLLAVGLATYALRASMFVVLGGRTLPRRIERPMTLLAPAAVAALAVSMLVVPQGNPTVPPVAEIAAVAAGFVAVRRSGNLLFAFAAGLPVYWALSVIAP